MNVLLHVIMVTVVFVIYYHYRLFSMILWPYISDVIAVELCYDDFWKSNRFLFPRSLPPPLGWVEMDHSPQLFADFSRTTTMKIFLGWLFFFITSIQPELRHNQNLRHNRTRRRTRINWAYFLRRTRPILNSANTLSVANGNTLLKLLPPLISISHPLL